ncbi:hypothetical protein GQ53DRAFT_136613 [Thozetella sp. PMI_491]|nr:hypothetical protein GQ53DRAFT_136613 [Thozetella sp. PMI_491]
MPVRIHGAGFADPSHGGFGLQSYFFFFFLYTESLFMIPNPRWLGSVKRPSSHGYIELAMTAMTASALAANSVGPPLVDNCTLPCACLVCAPHILRPLLFQPLASLLHPPSPGRLPINNTQPAACSSGFRKRPLQGRRYPSA